MTEIEDNSLDNEKTANDDHVFQNAIEAADVRVGALFATRYRILECLGLGGMGSVYKAEDISLGRVVAVKVLQYSGSPREIQRFHLEAKVIAKLNHPHIIRIFEISVTDDDKPYLVMDYVEGHTLADEIKDKRLPLDRALNTLKQACDAIEHAHSKGVVHRDIKPTNLMIVTESDSETIKLVDFGIAKLRSRFSSEDIQQLTQTGQMFGSPFYMSPEQIDCAAIDERTDIYSLGCVFYEMLTGVPPFQGKNVIETLTLHRSAEPEPIWKVVNDVPQAEKVQEVLNKMLAKETSSRFQNIGEVRAALEGLGTADGLPLSRMWKRFLLSSKSRSNKIRAVKVAAALLLVSGAAFLWYEFATITSGVQLEHVTPDIFTKTWGELNFVGQQALDRGEYVAARASFDKALILARLDSSKRKRDRVSASLDELFTLCDILNIPKPECTVKYTVLRPGVDSKNALKKGIAANEQNAGVEGVRNSLSMLADYVTLVDYTDKEVMPEALKSVRKKISELSNPPEVESLQLRILEILSEEPQIKSADRDELRTCLQAFDKLMSTDKKLARDWHWCLISTQAATVLKYEMELDSRLDLLDQASRSCHYPWQKLKCDNVKALLLVLFPSHGSARAVMEKAIQNYERSEERPGPQIAVACYTLGQMHLQERKPDQALPLMLRSRSLLKECINLVGLQEMDWRLVETYCALNKYDEALELANKLEESTTREQGMESVDRARALSAVGYVYANKLDWRKAESYMLQCMDILARRPANDPRAATVFVWTAKNLSTLYLKTGDREKAQDWSNRLAAKLNTSQFGERDGIEYYGADSHSVERNQTMLTDY